MGAIGTALQAAGGTQTKWDLFNQCIAEYCEKLVESGDIDKFVQKNYVPGKIDMFYIFADKWDRERCLRKREIMQEYLRIRESCGISVYDVVDDSQMFIMAVTPQNFESRERRVSDGDL